MKLSNPHHAPHCLLHVQLLGSSLPRLYCSPCPGPGNYGVTRSAWGARETLGTFFSMLIIATTSKGSRGQGGWAGRAASPSL